MRQAVLVNGKKWDSYHYDMLREEYMNIREDMLRKTLGEKLDEYLKKHCSLTKKP